MDDMLTQARAQLCDRLHDAGYPLDRPLTVRPLHADEAVGRAASPELAIRRGPEKVIQAEVAGTIGQAFTDQPGSWSGTVGDALALDLAQVPLRAISVAAINAILCNINGCQGVKHCQDGDPEACGDRMAEEIARRDPHPHIGMFGLQPFMVQALVGRFGAAAVTVADLNPANIGTQRAGVPIYDGQRDAATIVKNCSIGLITGSSIVNGTFDELWHLFAEHHRPVIVFGNTIAGVAALVGLDRYCPLAR